jgi:hypothetical protein
MVAGWHAQPLLAERFIRRPVRCLPCFFLGPFHPVPHTAVRLILSPYFTLVELSYSASHALVEFVKVNIGKDRAEIAPLGRA